MCWKHCNNVAWRCPICESKSDLSPDVHESLTTVVSKFEAYSKAFDSIAAAEKNKTDAVPQIMAGFEKIKALYEEGEFLVDEIILTYGVFRGGC